MRFGQLTVFIIKCQACWQQWWRGGRMYSEKKWCQVDFYSTCLFSFTGDKWWIGVSTTNMLKTNRVLWQSSLYLHCGYSCLDIYGAVGNRHFSEHKYSNDGSPHNDTLTDGKSVNALGQKWKKTQKQHRWKIASNLPKPPLCSHFSNRRQWCYHHVHSLQYKGPYITSRMRSSLYMTSTSCE